MSNKPKNGKDKETASKHGQDKNKTDSKHGQDKNNNNNNSKLNWWLIFCAVAALTAATRYYKVTEPDHVCWDETHFGKMASWYINRTFFFDVHPPLGKMLIALSGYVSGYNGTFPFNKPGDKYNGTRYEGMRFFCTTLGAAVIPMAFDVVHDLTGSMESSLMAALYLIFDVGLITLNQYILLDPILLFFMMASVWGMAKVSKFTRQRMSYSKTWWFWLFFTGAMLACTMSVKFVGIFVVLLVGLHTINALWLIYSDLEQPAMETLKQLASRALALIVLPILLYMLFFYIHLSVLNRSGNGDGFYSSAFQSRLIGNSLYNATMPRVVAYGSIVTIKNHKTGGGYLHSHMHLYPKGKGARQQQITTYTHKDDNNKWLIKHHNAEAGNAVQLIKNGDFIRLEHLSTRRNLHSHKEAAPLSRRHLQVTGYGENGDGDANDIWKLVIVGAKANVNATLKTVTSNFQLLHYLQDCVLTSSGKQLPKWGFEQQEVSCNKNMRDKNALWNIEDNQHKQLASENFSVYAPGFWARFMESHAVMFQGNAGLKPKDGEVTSRPWQWPINYRGQYFSGNIYRIYLLGNPFIWWSNLVFLMLFILSFLVNAIRQRRQEGRLKHNQENSEKLNKKLKNSSTASATFRTSIWLFIGWLVHYAPFWSMGRVLYFHHYFPALVFNSMLSGVMFHYLTKNMPKFGKSMLLALMITGLLYSYKIFSPLAYGMKGPLAHEPESIMYGLKWLRTWEF